MRKLRNGQSKLESCMYRIVDEANTPYPLGLTSALIACQSENTLRRLFTIYGIRRLFF